MNAQIFNARLGLVQRVLPAYRVPFFDALAQACAGGLQLFAGQPRTDEALAIGTALHTASLAAAKNMHLFSPSSPFYFCYQQGLPGWLDGWNPDALILEANFRYLSSPAAVRWMHAHGRPVIGWGLGAPLARGGLAGLRQRFLSQFDAMLVYSQRGAQQYAACGIPADKIFVAPNAVAAAPSQPLLLREPVFAGRPVLLFVGRLQARKRLPALLKACASLPGPLQPRLLIVGEGPELEKLSRLAQGCYPQTEFTGALHGEALVPYYQAADLFVLPGTGGLAVQQAMSYGLPVVVARGDGTQDDLVRPGNGWQIATDDDDALVEVLREALSDAARLRAMGAESYRIVAHEINLEKMVETFVGALNSVC